MARTVASNLPPALLETEQDAGSSEELLPRAQESRWLLPRVAAAGLAIGALAACALMVAVGSPHSATSRAHASPRAQPVTVRQLLEGPELTDAVTDNFMSLGHAYLSSAQRGSVRAAVADNLANISSSLRARLPADHAQLNLIQLSQEQQDSVLRVVRHYSDPRVLRLGDDIAEVVDEARAEGGDKRTVHRRLLAKLRPRLRELQELSEEMVPGSSVHLNLDEDDEIEDLEHEQTSGKGHLKAARRGGAAGLLAARRLSARDTLSGTRDQATTALRHVEGLIGKPMPAAPARMLLFDKQKEYEQSTTGMERFTKCVMDNADNLPDMFTCLMTNCKRAMTWLMNKLHLQDMMEKMASSAR